MTCPYDIIFHDTNLGTDGDPVIVPVVACDHDCGFEIPFCDDTGRFHDAHDWYVTSSDFRRYEEMHRAFSTQDASWLEREDLKESLRQMRAGEGTVRIPKEDSPPDEQCPNCHHPKSQHDQLLEGAGKIMFPEYNPYQVDDLYECNVYAGMGNWCGCRHWSRQKTRPEGPNGYEVPIP